MKDSGITWIGDIPCDWVIVPLNRIFHIKAGGDLKPEVFSDKKTKKHLYPIYTNSTTLDAIYGFTSKPIFEKDTITVTGRGAVGFAIYRGEPYDAIIRLLVLSKKTHLSCKYFTFYINSKLTFNEGRSAINQLSTKQISPYLVTFPPIEEQQKIVDYLEEKTSKIDSLIEDTTKQITLLKEYRQSLISEVVTGKVEILKKHLN